MKTKVTKTKIQKSRISKQDSYFTDVKLSVRDCNEWIRNNQKRIIDLYLRSIHDEKKKLIELDLNNLVKKEREQNPSKFMTSSTLNTLKKLTDKNKMSFTDWKQESKINNSRIYRLNKKIDPVKVESINQFVERGGVVNKIKTRKKKSI